MALDAWPWEDEFEPNLLRLSRRLSEPALEDVAAACARLIGQYRVAWVAGPTTHHAAPRKRQVRASATATQRRGEDSFPDVNLAKDRPRHLQGNAMSGSGDYSQVHMVLIEAR